MYEQKRVFHSGNELAALAAKQIRYHVMGYYPITPSTKIAEYLDELRAAGFSDVYMIPADGEHSAAGICYGACTAGGRVFNATSANGLLYALEQLPVQSGTRFPMVMNVACRTVSGPLSIKGDHSDIMYTLNTGWVILFAKNPQEVYDMNLCGLKIAEAVALPVIVAFDGFFTSHQERVAMIFERDEDVRYFVGESYTAPYHVLDPENPITIGAYMNEPDIMNNKYQLHLAMEEARRVIPQVFQEYAGASGRQYSAVQGYGMEDAQAALFILGSSYETAKEAVDQLRKEGLPVGVFTTNVLRPFPKIELFQLLNPRLTGILAADRQDSYGAEGGNMSLELKAMLQDHASSIKVISRIYGLSGKDFYVEEAVSMLRQAYAASQKQEVEVFDYSGRYQGEEEADRQQYFAPIARSRSTPGITSAETLEDGSIKIKGGTVRDGLQMPRRLAPGHGACPGCGIPINVNLLLKGIEGNVVLLFHTGCGMVVTTPYPKTAFKVSYVHNLFQSGAPTLSGIVAAFEEKQRRGELPEGDDFTFVMVSGDGGMDIGMGAALGTALRNPRMILMEYDNGGYMNTGYQLSYSTPKGAKTSTSHVGPAQYGKTMYHKDTPQIFSATGIPYIATVGENQPADFIKKAAKAARYAQSHGMAYIKALSACPLNWNDNPRYERSVIDAGVNCCYHPLYEIENGITTLSYDPEEKGKKIPVAEFFKMMGRTKHLTKPNFEEIMEDVQREVDRRWERLKARAESPVL